MSYLQKMCEKVCYKNVNIRKLKKSEQHRAITSSTIFYVPKVP